MLRALPPSVLVDSQYRILFVHGQTGRYLELKPGVPGKDASLLDMAREGIKTALSTAVAQAASHNEVVVRQGERLKVNSHTVRVRITVKPVVTEDVTRLVVSFEDVVEAPPGGGVAKRRRRASG
jgi:two-component system CheB/CheR fusion protein